MTNRKYSVLAWVVAALLIASAGALVLSHDPVIAGGGESSTGESSTGETTPSGSGE